MHGWIDYGLMHACMHASIRPSIRGRVNVEVSIWQGNTEPKPGAGGRVICFYLTH